MDSLNPAMAEALRPLIEAAKGGDRDALNRLAGCVDRFVRIFSGSLSNHLRRTYGSTVDFVLEGLAEALSNLSSFEYKNDEQFYSWVSCHIRNVIAGAGRHEGRGKRAGRPAAFGSHADDLEAPGPGLSTIISSEEVRSEMAKALLDEQVASPREMEVVVLKLYEGQSWPAIRDKLDLSSEKRARTLFVQGIDLLRRRVEKTLGPSALSDFIGL